MVWSESALENLSPRGVISFSGGLIVPCALYGVGRVVRHGRSVVLLVLTRAHTSRKKVQWLTKRAPTKTNRQIGVDARFVTVLPL